MPAPEEISAWSLDEIRAEIRALLPAGWTATDAKNSGGYWIVTIESPGEYGSVLELVEANADERLALLNAFGWLWTKSLPKPGGDSPWQRRGEVTPPKHAASGSGTSVPDPDDLDPKEIAQVYEKFQK
jgi:hypothetical protein